VLFVLIAHFEESEVIIVFRMKAAHVLSSLAVVVWQLRENTIHECIALSRRSVHGNSVGMGGGDFWLKMGMGIMTLGRKCPISVCQKNSQIPTLGLQRGD